MPTRFDLPAARLAVARFARKASKLGTDEEIIAKHDPSVRARARIELKIVNALIARADELECTIEINECPEASDVRATLFDLDVANITVRDRDGERVGWAHLVFGNDGFDLISDYTWTDRFAEFIGPVIELGDRIAGGTEPMV